MGNFHINLEFLEFLKTTSVVHVEQMVWRVSVYSSITLSKMIVDLDISHDGLTRNCL